MAIYNLTGTDEEISVQGRYASVKNNGTETVYASSAPDLEPNAADVVPIQAGESVIVRDCRKKLYVRGSGQIAVVSGNEPVNFFKPAPKGGGGGSGDGITQQQLNDTLKSYATNTSIDTKLEGYVSKDEILGNPNLLLNPDFKVNQRGRTEYSGYTSTVDKWEKTTAGIVTVDSDGVTLNNTNGTTAMYWGQVLSLDLANEPVSLSACDSDGNIYSISGIAPEESKNPLKRLISNIGSFYVDLNVDHYEFFFQVKAGKSIKIKWAKLEYGATVTSFVPPNPTEEALKCGPLKNYEQQIFYGDRSWGDVPSNPNLLNNPDFKVNQRGKSEYGYDGKDRYTVDQWKLQANLTLTVHNDYVTVSRHDPTGIYYTGFRQFSNIPDDTLITMQVCVRGNGSFTLTYKGLNGTTEKQVQDTDGWVVVKCTGYGASEVGVLLRGTATSLDIKWIKLELGSVATPFVPPNITEETLKCGPIENPEQQVFYGDSVWRNIPSNPNLLDNPDFKINQRGQSEYTSTIVGANIYTVDRWKIYSSNTCIVEKDGITIKRNSGDRLQLYQYVDYEYERLAGEKVTMSVKFANDETVYSVSGTIPLTAPTDTSYIMVTTAKNGCRLGIWYTTSLKRIVYQLYKANPTEGETIKIEWAKLEFGTVATPFVPPNPATELLKCQRCYQRLNLIMRHIGTGYVSAIGDSSFSFMACIPLPTSMRTSSPTGKIEGVLYVWLPRHYGGSAFTTNRLASSISLSANMLVLPLAIDSTDKSLNESMYGWPGSIQFRDSESYLELSADL